MENGTGRNNKKFWAKCPEETKQKLAEALAKRGLTGLEVLIWKIHIINEISY